jgi:phosphoribosylanthranilate isomerase
MSAPAIKICGITTAETLTAVIAARADYVGFNFYVRSPRFVSLDQVKPLAAQAAGRISRVGVFVDDCDTAMTAAIAAAKLDVLQLHGGESPARVAQLRAGLAIPVWKVISVSSRADLARAADYVGAADFILLDAKTSKGDLPGGMGLSFDWALLSGWQAPLPWGLAGGLTAANVGTAITLTGAPLVDTSSGVESAPGVKDCALIAAFCAAARTA